ncbi:MAG TPA: outer membrane beta-barrel protein [Terriglobales bacterium]|nr:outer membrane beta-barrel protein [Terriglobales bacterium]
MRKVLFIAVVAVVCGCFAAAQDYPKAELFGGFSYLHADTEGATGASLTTALGFPAGTSVQTWYPGWEVAGQYNFTKLLGIKADFSGNYGTPVKVPGFALPHARTYTFLFGPVVSVRRDRVTPFVHALFGGNHIGADASTVLTTPAVTETAFAMALGGGLDVKLTRHFGARLGQFDYLYTKHCLSLPANFGGFAGNAAGCQLGVGSAPPAHQNNFRFATGILITP